MSFFVIGLLELSVNSRSQEAFDYANIISEYAVANHFYVELKYQFNDSGIRDILEPLHDKYFNKSSHNIVEFMLADSPLIECFDGGISELFTHHTIQHKDCLF